jgi:hypothetical protein
MRQAYITEAKHYRAAKRIAPWAAIIAKASGGFIAFESVTDYYIWRKQI